MPRRARPFSLVSSRLWGITASVKYLSHHVGFGELVREKRDTIVGLDMSFPARGGAVRTNQRMLSET